MSESKSQLKRRAIQRPDSVHCPKCKFGAMFDISSRLAVGMGVKQTRCDKCGHQIAFKIGEGA